MKRAHESQFRARAALIDLDGTLVDSLPDIATAVNMMRSDMGFAELPDLTIGTYIGKGVEVLVRRSLSESMDAAVDSGALARGRELFGVHYGAVNGARSRVYDGVREALQELHGKGIKLACVTNKPRVFTLQLLQRMELQAAFAAVVAGDDTPQKKPHAEPMLHACALLKVAAADAVVIGDSDNDMQSARAAGCASIRVQTGYNEGRSVSHVDADAIVATLLHAANLIESRTL